MAIETGISINWVKCQKFGLKPQSYVVLDEINSRKITGSFQINFVLAPDITFPKLDETIPDTFNISNGSFSAEKF